MVEHTAHNRVVAGSIPATATTLVALSGGPDSTALLLTLQEQGNDVVAAHFDHALRPDSGDDAAWCRALCRRLGVRLVEGRRQAELAKGSLQAAARAARYAFLEASADRLGIETIALGHTADDVVEGLLLHLLRGSALAGLRGMPQRRDRFVRPLLGVWREEIEVLLAERGIHPCRDPSNQDRRFARVRVRHDLLPALERTRPGIKMRLLRTAQLAAELQSRLEERARREGRSSASPVVRMAHYRALYSDAGGRLPALNRRQLEALDRLQTGGELSLPGGIVARRTRSDLLMEKAGTPALAGVHEIVSFACDGCLAPDAAHLKPAVYRVGRRRPGLRMRPLPHGHTRKVQDVLVDAGVPRHLRDALPIVFAGEEVAWIPGVAIDARFAAEAGKRCAHIEVDAEGARVQSGHRSPRRLRLN